MPMRASFGSKATPSALHDKNIILLISVGKGLRAGKNIAPENEYIKSFLRRLNFNRTKHGSIPKSITVMVAGVLQRWDFQYFAKKNIEDKSENDIRPLSDAELHAILKPRDIQVLSTFPRENDLPKHRNTYMFIKNSSELFYINSNGGIEKLALNNIEQFNNLVEHFDELNKEVTFTSITNYAALARGFEALIAANAGHSALNQFTNETTLAVLMAKEFEPFAKLAENNYIQRNKEVFEKFPKLSAKMTGWEARKKYAHHEEGLTRAQAEYKTSTPFQSLIEKTIDNFLANKMPVIEEAIERIILTNPKLSHISAEKLARISCQKYLFEEIDWFRILEHTNMFYPDKIPIALKPYCDDETNDFDWTKLVFKHKSNLDDLEEEIFLYSDDPHYSKNNSDTNKLMTDLAVNQEKIIDNKIILGHDTPSLTPKDPEAIDSIYASLKRTKSYPLNPSMSPLAEKRNWRNHPPLFICTKEPKKEKNLPIIPISTPLKPIPKSQPPAHGDSAPSATETKQLWYQAWNFFTLVNDTPPSAAKEAALRKIEEAKALLKGIRVN